MIQWLGRYSKYVTSWTQENLFSFLAWPRDLSLYRSSRTEYSAQHSRIQWSNGALSKLPACDADHQLYHLTMSRMNGATSSLPPLPPWAPKGQPFIALSFLHNFFTVMLLKSLHLSFESYGWKWKCFCVWGMEWGWNL